MILPPRACANCSSTNPDTGQFIWRVNRRGPAKAGDIAGKYRARGDCLLCIDQHRIMAHRAAWLYVTGEHPPMDIDHVNGNPSDNRWSNLRCVDRSTNCENARVARSRKNGGELLGAHWSTVWRRWKTSITVNRKKIHIGWFDTERQAHDAYIAAKRRLHEGCTI